MTQTRYQLGRLPATRPHGLSTLATYATGKLPKPPAAIAVPTFQIGMDCNDSIGDCTIAGVDHLIGAWDAEVSVSDPRPDDDEIQATYFKLTGGQDSGLNEADVLKAWSTSGLFGNTIAGYAPVEPTDVVGLHQAIAFYGGAYLGIACPESAQTDFQNGQPWTYDPSSPIEGGHCIVALGYDSGAVYCATWGGIAPVTYPFLAHFLEETWAVLSQEFVEAKGDSLNIDLATLQADLAGV